MNDMKEIQGLRPDPSQDSKPYWDGLLQGRILIQQCDGCGRFRHYPRPVCPHCYSMDLQWVEAEGTGTVHSWAVSHHAFHPAYKKDLPVTFVTVDLPEGARLVAPLRGNGADRLALGAPVLLGVEQVDNDLALPVVRMAAD